MRHVKFFREVGFHTSREGSHVNLSPTIRRVPRSTNIADAIVRGCPGYSSYSQHPLMVGPEIADDFHHDFTIDLIVARDLLHKNNLG